MIILKGAKEPTADGSIKEQLIGHPYMKFFKLAPVRFLIFAHDQILNRNTLKTKEYTPHRVSYGVPSRRQIMFPQTCLYWSTTTQCTYCEGVNITRMCKLDDQFVVRHNHK